MVRSEYTATVSRPEQGLEELHYDKVIFPQETLNQLVAENAADPFIFELHCKSSGVTTHCGVHDFTSNTGGMIMSQNLYLRLNPTDNERIRVRTVLLPNGKSTVFQPSTTIDCSGDVQVFLQESLRHYATLTKGDAVALPNGVNLVVKQVEPSVRGSTGIHIRDVELEVDFVAPLDGGSTLVSAQTLNLPPKGNSKSVEAKLDETHKHLYFNVPFLDSAARCKLTVTSSQITHVDLATSWAEQYPSNGSVIPTTTTFDGSLSLVIENPPESQTAFHFAIIALLPTTSAHTIPEIDLTITLQDVSMERTLNSSSSPAVSVSASNNSGPSPMETDETQECTVCGHKVPTFSYERHFAFCSRKNVKCDACGRVVLRDDLAEHKSSPACIPIVKCECGVELRRSALQTHRDLECPMALQPCQYCGAPIARINLVEHTETCGARTMKCPLCTSFVKVSEQNAHANAHHGCAWHELDALLRIQKEGEQQAKELEQLRILEDRREEQRRKDRQLAEHNRAVNPAVLAAEARAKANRTPPPEAVAMPVDVAPPVRTTTTATTTSSVPAVHTAPAHPSPPHRYNIPPTTTASSSKSGFGLSAEEREARAREIAAKQHAIAARKTKANSKFNEDHGHALSHTPTHGHTLGGTDKSPTQASKEAVLLAQKKAEEERRRIALATFKDEHRFHKPQETTAKKVEEPQWMKTKREAEAAKRDKEKALKRFREDREERRGGT
eukprot:TRINITY_DN64223_c0_g1_i1.p1 TRINITY_DN64223_c0_g1~~TRINITY_DN64223_c0_g1_i1.p1  ORF type:complete len:727 (+),score=51.41 TRINITY_DN64223_c0_g1_i1:39-2219(+)